jgi:tetratricopeptide (TPR) repeat protein
VSDVEIARGQLVAALLQIPELEHRSVRDARIDELRESIARDLDVERSDDVRADLSALIDAFATAPADLRAFAEIIARRHPGEAASRFVRLTATGRPAQRARLSRTDDHILGDIPIRNRNFTGREDLLTRLGRVLNVGTPTPVLQSIPHGVSVQGTSVLPPTLKGLGGVGKTQLVIEYVHRHIDQYDLIWWIPAEQTATVLASLTQLAERLELPAAGDQKETARTVLNWLAGSDREWLLVYDNAENRDDIVQLLPSTGGHVIVTTRNEEWSNVGVAIEVDVFLREESVQLLTKRTGDQRDSAAITPKEADELAERLGDLPLALEQAAAWYLATGMPISEYIGLLDSRTKDLLSEGKPAEYPMSVVAFVAVAVEKLRAADEATAQMFSLFAYLGGEPIRLSLLRRGYNADLSQPLRDALGDSFWTGKMVRDLRQYGLVRAVGKSVSAGASEIEDKTPRLQVHRLVQVVLRETLTPEQQRETLSNVQKLLALVDPGDPDEVGEFNLQREMGPHIEPADLIRSGTAKGRQAVLHHARFLYLIGDFESSRALAERAAKVWTQDLSSDDLGENGQQTLLARGQIANATRMLGDSETAARTLRDVYDRFVANPKLGPEHGYTLITGNQLGHDLRIRGRYREALEFDRRSVALHRKAFGAVENYSLRALGNLAVDHRLIGEFAEALRLDHEIADQWADVGGVDVSVLRAYMNVARDYYGLGAYKSAIEQLRKWLPVQEKQLGKQHAQVLMSERTYAITLRKLGDVEQAVELMRDNYRRTLDRFHANHELAVAASMSLANALRQAGAIGEALELIAGTLVRYRSDFGDDHPLTLAAQVNEAIAHRAAGDVMRALEIDRDTYALLQRALGREHPYTICAGSSLATDYALVRDHRAALRLSDEMRDLSRTADAGGTEARDGADHPYVLMRAINRSHDLRANGEEGQAEALYRTSLERLGEILGDDHPEVIEARAGRRLEGDIEPPPT